MVEVLTYHNIDDILDNPQDYIDDTQDIVLVRINGTFIEIGMDEDGKMYFVVEDDEVSEDRYLEDFYPSMTIKEAYDSIVDELTKEDEE